jgi:multidrug resistance efflux pump
VEIIHERPSQRLHYRVTAPMRITFGAQNFDAVDWGLGGCRISGLSGELPDIGTQHTLLCTLPFQGFNITLKAEAELIRHDDKSCESAFRFTQLGEREAALMQHFVEDLVRGKMTDVADTIVRIDTPVTPVPIKPDPNPVHDIPVRRWPIKQIMMTCFYFALGVAVFGYVGVYAFATLFRLEIQSAVVSAERMQISAPINGRVAELPQRRGTQVAAGSIIAVMEDTSHDMTLQKAKSDLAQTRAQLAETNVVLAEERRRAEGYTLVARNNVRQAESQLDGLELARDNATLKLERLKVLAAKGLVLADDVEAAELEIKSVVSDLERKKIHIQELKELIEGGDSIRLFTGNAFAGRLAEMEARAARLSALQDHYQELVSVLSLKETRQLVLAPFDGRVIDTAFVAGNVLKQGEPLLVFEEVGAEVITAFLTQEEVLQVRIGSSANLFLPTEDRWISAEVTVINRTEGFVDEVTDTHRFRAPDARSAKVTLAPIVDELPASGTPVSVYFQRFRNNVVWRTSQQFLEAI